MVGYDFICFDLDGTLTDPKVGITRAVCHGLMRIGIVEEELDRLTPFIGPPLLESFARYYNLEPSRAAQAVTFYREYFSTVGLYENTVYPGIPQMLAALQAAGKQLFVATSKPTVFAQTILDHFDLSQYFRLIVGSNLDNTRVAKTEVLAHLLTEAAIRQNERVVMVGDREHDVIGARNNGLDSIGVDYGYGSLDELRAAGPTYIVGSVAELTLVLVGSAARLAV